jgi:capsid protein
LRRKKPRARACGCSASAIAGGADNGREAALSNRRRIQHPPSAPSALTVQRARASYDGAARTDRTASWNGSPDISAHFALSLYGPELRRRSWIAYRNIAIARRGVERMADALVGSGARPRMRGVPTADAQRWLRLWERWTGQADPTGATTFFGLQRQACLEMLIGGDALARFRERRLIRSRQRFHLRRLRISPIIRARPPTNPARIPCGQRLNL